jgi:2'-5' RNA ligase
MSAATKTHAVVLTFRDSLEKVIAKLLADYEEYFHRDIVPHLTLIYPFTPVFSLFRVNEQLEKVAGQTKPFAITFDGLDFFEENSNVVYAAVANARAVKNLHFNLVGSLEGLIKELETDGRFNLEMFVPHVTIGNKIPDDMFLELKRKLSRYHFHYEDDITDFTLFSEANGVWQPKRVFKLEG